MRVRSTVRVVVAMCALGLLFAWLIGTTSPVVAGPNGGDGSGAQKESGEGPAKVDRVELAGTLLRDGHRERAKRVLSKVEPGAEEVDRALYYTLRGILALEERKFEAAVEHLDDAIRYGQTDDMVFVHLAQAYYGLRDWKKTIQSVRNSEEAVASIPDLYLMEAEAQRKLGRDAEAWRTLQKGHEAFPDRPEYARQQVFLLVEMGLYRAALKRGEAFLKQRDDVGAEDYIAVAEAFRRSGAHEQAQVLLERARQRFPEHTEMIVHLAHAYVGSGDLVAAGALLQVAAESKSTYVRESAELFRRAGAYERALFMNSRIVDQSAKFEQRVAILLDQKDYARIASLEDRLERLGLLERPEILYALAYAHFKTRDYDRALALAKRVEDPELFESAVELRRAVARCRAKPWQC